jgi:hypothetical protein
MMKKYVLPLVLLFICSVAADLRAVEPVYSLDSMTHHPYRYVPAFGHASQNPGSPRHFVPGYGYSIPGFGASSANLAPNTNYSLYYQFGHRTHGLYNDATHRFWHNSYGGPWYHPGASTNTQDRWPGM